MQPYRLIYESFRFKVLEKISNTAADELKGDWVLIGGTLLPALGIDHRVTTDIDLVSLESGESNESVKSTLQLMQLAENMGLAIETINQAALYFLEKIPGYRDSLVLLHTGKKGRIYRPNATLFLLLKIKRLSESDLQDCLQWLKWIKKQGEPLELERIQKAIKSESMRPGLNPEKRKHLIRLEQKITTIKQAIKHTRKQVNET